MSDSESDFSFEKTKGKKVTKKITKKSPAAKSKKKPAKGKAASKGKKTTKTNSKSKQTKGKGTTTSAKRKKNDSDAEDFLPGQKVETPDDNDSCRVFYQTLYQQNPNSLIAQKYCLEKGLIPEDEIQKVMKNLQKQKGKK